MDNQPQVEEQISDEDHKDEEEEYDDEEYEVKKKPKSKGSKRLPKGVSLTTRRKRTALQLQDIVAEALGTETSTETPTVTIPEPSQDSPTKPDSPPPRTRSYTTRSSTTYIEMIEQAIGANGGKATSSEIIEYLEEHFNDVISTKTKTWRNSVCGSLSSHFTKTNEQDPSGRSVWAMGKPTPRGKASGKSGKVPKADAHITTSESEEFSDDPPKRTRRTKRNRSDSEWNSSQKNKKRKGRSRKAQMSESEDDLSDDDFEELPPPLPSSITSIHKEAPLSLVKKLNHIGRRRSN